ncbi:probable transmembrane reductase CYB561D1 [Diorhabda carinulata]|uniref:probable transmembrane reductase CYB561D1 n=1 Tax=Diorhabda carinulata TaxID=1163345 RepID=UPI0025A2319E|nr:probable transmembrane reductase CYB561D1 [Diorhabda carinulata]
MAALTNKERFFHVSEILFQQVIAVFVLLIIWELFKSYSISSKHTWHIVMSVLGLALCMAEGIQIFRRESIVTFGHSREEKRTAHLVMMGLGFVSLTIGISLRISVTEDASRSHFSSIHAQLGLTTWILSFVSAMGGSISYFFPTSFNPRIIKLLHIFIGISTFIIGITTLSLGIKNYLLSGFQRGWITLIVLLALYGSYCLISPLTSFFNYLISK